MKTVFAFNHVYLTILFFVVSIPLMAQSPPQDLPWPANCGSEVSILHEGIAVITCGVREDIPANERFTMALISVNDAIPGSGRSETTDPDSVYHHSSWVIAELGNVFGTAINTRTHEFFVTASSNYGAGFGFLNSAPVALNYGSIGNPADQTEAAGTVYRIDNITGQATVFARLPQQSTTLSHYDCEDERIEIVRNNTGVGLGNIVFDSLNNQFFVTNIEDGRIYRLDDTGTVLDSYDPLTYDDGVANISDIEQIPYGLAVEPGSQRLFFGLIDDPTPVGNGQAAAGMPQVYSIDLNGTGGFIGTVDNTYLPPGITTNYVGTEQLHLAIPTGPGNSFTNHTSYFISDLDFTPDGELFVAIRVGCYGSFFSSYNHHAEVDIVTLNGGTNLYDSPTELDLTELGDAGPEDTYGGVSVYRLKNGDVHYTASAADILDEQGPHGIAIWDEVNSNVTPVSPLGAFSYGLADDQDPKGMGGDIEVISGCPVAACVVSQTNSSLCDDNGTPSDVAHDYFDLTVTGTVTDGSGNYTVTVNGYTSPSTASGTPVTMLGDGTHTNLAADGAATYLVRIEDATDSNCFVEFTTTAVNACSIPICMVSQTNSSLCNDNGTPSNMGDDYFDLTVTGTVTDGSGNYTVTVNGYTSPSTASGTPVTILGDGTHTGT